MEKSIIDLKSINDLLKLEFLIPSYQRGYRWTGRQVEDLLNDIYEFIQKKEAKSDGIGDFYCLQPIIVKKESESRFRLIDGQQRLTTIYIILYYLEKKKFSIEFETRKTSKLFLENISEVINNENIDFHHISNAYIKVKEWFEKLEEFEATIQEEFFINLGKYTKVIWYEINENEDERDVFTRINSGKIPLTNAELIKALFLNSKNFEEEDKHLRQIEIAKEWDDMEYSLQNDEFWYFLAKNKDYHTRIELLFEIFSNEEIVDEFSTYRFFSKQKDIVKIWSENEENIKKVFLSIKYWFDNRKLYHLIGYLISTDKFKIEELYTRFKKKTKSKFRNELITAITEDINIDNIETLDYNDNKEEVLKVLLLFNIATILNNCDSYIRFAFDKFNDENWSIEHIHAQQDKGLQSNEAIKHWLIDTKKQLELVKLTKEGRKEVLEKLIKSVDKMLLIPQIKRDNSDFYKLQNNIFDFFGETVHTLDNLALLSSSINSSLSNNIFPLKREILIKKDKNGEFIPLCTKNVFLKYYSTTAPDLFFWSNDDRRDYLKEIKSTIQKF